MAESSESGSEEESPQAVRVGSSKEECPQAVRARSSKCSRAKVGFSQAEDDNMPVTRHQSLLSKGPAHKTRQAGMEPVSTIDDDAESDEEASPSCPSSPNTNLGAKSANKAKKSVCGPRASKSSKGATKSPGTRAKKSIAPHVTRASRYVPPEKKPKAKPKSASNQKMKSSSSSPIAVAAMKKDQSRDQSRAIIKIQSVVRGAASRTRILNLAEISDDEHAFAVANFVHKLVQERTSKAHARSDRRIVKQYILKLITKIENPIVLIEGKFVLCADPESLDAQTPSLVYDTRYPCQAKSILTSVFALPPQQLITPPEVKHIEVDEPTEGTTWLNSSPPPPSPDSPIATALTVPEKKGTDAEGESDCGSCDAQTELSNSASVVKSKGKPKLKFGSGKALQKASKSRPKRSDKTKVESPTEAEPKEIELTSDLKTSVESLQTNNPGSEDSSILVLLQSIQNNCHLCDAPYRENHLACFSCGNRRLEFWEVERILPYVKPSLGLGGEIEDPILLETAQKLKNMFSYNFLKKLAPISDWMVATSDTEVIGVNPKQREKETSPSPRQLSQEDTLFGFTPSPTSAFPQPTWGLNGISKRKVRRSPTRSLSPKPFSDKTRTNISTMYWDSNWKKSLRNLTLKPETARRSKISIQSHELPNPYLFDSGSKQNFWTCLKKYRKTILRAFRLDFDLRGNGFATKFDFVRVCRHHGFEKETEDLWSKISHTQHMTFTFADIGGQESHEMADLLDFLVGQKQSIADIWKMIADDSNVIDRDQFCSRLLEFGYDGNAELACHCLDSSGQGRIAIEDFSYLQILLNSMSRSLSQLSGKTLGSHSGMTDLASDLASCSKISANTYGVGISFTKYAIKNWRDVESFFHYDSRSSTGAKQIPDSEFKRSGGRQIPDSEFKRWLNQIGIGDVDTLISKIHDEFNQSGFVQHEMRQDNSVSLAQVRYYCRSMGVFVRRKFVNTMKYRRGGGSVFRAWRLDFDKNGDGYLNKTNFVRSCGACGCASDTDILWYALRSDYSDQDPLELWDFAPHEAVEIQEFAASMLLACDWDMDEAWKMVTPAKLKRTTFPFFDKICNKIGYSGQTVRLFQCLDLMGTGVLTRQSFEDAFVICMNNIMPERATPSRQARMRLIYTMVKVRVLQLEPERLLQKLRLDRPWCSILPEWEYRLRLRELGYHNALADAALSLVRALTRARDENSGLVQPNKPGANDSRPPWHHIETVPANPRPYAMKYSKHHPTVRKSLFNLLADDSWCDNGFSETCRTVSSY